MNLSKPSLAVFVLCSISAQATDYRPEVLSLVRQRVANTKSLGATPVVLFDLDETLINSRTRAIRIFQGMARDPWLTRHYPQATSALSEILNGSDSVLYSLIKTYILYPDLILSNDLGISDAAFIDATKEAYLDSYLSNAECGRDIEIPGGRDFAQSLWNAGAHIVYITGRNGPGMGRCTLEALVHIGFPQGERVTLFMKPKRTLDDTEFKRQTMKDVGTLGTVVAGFENEPANLNAFHDAFPEGVYGFVDTLHSNKPDVPFDGAYWIRDFQSQ